MFFNLNTSLYTLALALLPLSLAVITPTSPDGSTVVTVGENINALWTADTTGQWTNVEIDLMTGDNYQMVHLATLATGVDGTSTTQFTIAAPDVSPYSKIYFLQFTLGGDVSTATWTTRFTIAGADGSTTDPTNSTVYTGSTTPVQWGTGTLIGAVAAANSTDSASSTAASTAASPVTTTTAAASADSTSAALVSAVASASASSVSSVGASAVSAAPATSSTGAALPGSTIGLGAVVLAMAGLIAL